MTQDKQTGESALAIRRRKNFTEAEVQALLNAAWSMGLTEHLALFLAANTGLRVGELVLLDHEDFDAAGGSAFVHTLKQRESVLDEHIIGPGVVLAVQYFQKKIGRVTGPLFMDDKGKRLLKKILQGWFDAAAEKAGIDTRPPSWAPKDARGRGIHGLRHSWISRLAKVGADPGTLMSQARHSSFATTQVYLDDLDTRKLVDEVGVILPPERMRAKG